MSDVERARALLGVGPDASSGDLHQAWRLRSRTCHPDVGGTLEAMQRLNAAYELCRRALASAESGASERVDHDHGDRGMVQRDSPSFVIEAPVDEAFELLQVVASWLGAALVDDGPDVLEVHLDAPAACWCRLELVAEAGVTTVSVTVAPVEGAEAPSPVEVRDRWITAINELQQPG